MAGALTQAINFPSSVACSETQKTFTLTINGQINRSRNTINSVKMAFSTVNAPALIIRKFSGLRVSNALDRALKPEIDFHSRIASKIYFRRAKSTRLAPKAIISDVGRGSGESYKMPTMEKFGTDLIKLAEVVQMIGGGSGESKVSALAEYGTDLVKVLAAEVIQIVGENKNNEAVGVGGGSGQSKMPTLEKWGTNLIKLAEENKHTRIPLIGRNIEVRHIFEILDRRTTNNPWLIGESGVGKTTIVDHVARMIAYYHVPAHLVGKKVIRLDMSQLVVGAKSCREFEEIIKRLMEEVTQNDNIILFIDGLTIGTGAAEETINSLKLALARSELQCIVATTPDEYKKLHENDYALEYRFQTVKVLEPSVKEAIRILRLLKHLYEFRDNVCFTEDALVAAVKLSKRYISDCFLPGKAKRLMDEAGNRVHLCALRLSDEAEYLEEEKRRVIREKDEASSSGYLEKAAILHIRELVLQSRITAIISKCKEMRKAGKGEGPTVTVADICNVVSLWTGIPVEKVIGEEKEAVDATVKKDPVKVRCAKLGGVCY